MPTIMTIVGTRPEIIKLSRVIAALDQFTNHILVHTGQNYDYNLNEVFFEQMKIRKPDHFLNAAAETPIGTISEVLVKVDALMDQLKPDAVLLYGDTNSCLSAIPAKRRKIPVFHMEAGNRCFDQRVPEEINRKIIDHISDINMTTCEHARRYLVSEGIKPETVINVGSCMKEILDFYKEDIDKSEILSTLQLKPQQYFLVSIHREENVDNPMNFVDLLNSLNRIAEIYNLPVIVSTHPRTRKKIDSAYDGFVFNNFITFVEPVGFLDYIKLQQNAYCVLSDSGTITEESTILNFPAITIRQAHERPEGMDEATLIMSGLNSEEVLTAIDVVVNTQDTSRLIEDYNVDNVSNKVVRIILSYIGYINRTVWRK